MTEPEGELPMIRQFQDWIQKSPSESDPERSRFFTEGVIVLDTNILLSLYEYTPTAREQILDALRSVQSLLWLPHQVGLEFFQNRHRVITGRKKALEDSQRALRNKISEAKQALKEARSHTQKMLIRYAQDTEASSRLEKQISDKVISDLLSDLSSTLESQASRLRDYDISVSPSSDGDTVLTQVAALFRDQIASPPAPDVTRQRVEDASQYRFPNLIPPGFKDAGKGTALASSGDFLLWEETISHMADSESRSHLLFVSNDTKEDWYQPSGEGRNEPRPWPYLKTEMRMRAGAELRIETPGAFYRGINHFLHAEITETTYAEIDRAAAGATPASVTEAAAVRTPPPPDLVTAALDAAGLEDALVCTITDTAHRSLFLWWLIGTTAQLERRPIIDDEPDVLFMPATRQAAQPDPNWLPGTRLHLGEWPYRSSSWIAPWFVDTLNASSVRDRKILQGLAAQQLAFRPRDV
ncbi:PIN-like domain-containing protein [Streptomyces pakalii]|uniref:PIN-like domain-containing protein n=1 Tax=Streptomyces pakalii TaxID=3036494 RepID=A0ABT7DBK7_9ACTN|nr:PIN-like domain-containing protein [Streptomyces pakalii]MDJ1643200.1 PIN-like domain-containing protein [Streptomyces pakalii]